MSRQDIDFINKNLIYLAFIFHALYAVFSTEVVLLAASPDFDRVSPVLGAARTLLESSQISYVYGGSNLGDSQSCDACNRCLESASPRPAQRLALCPSCQSCSLDCSHFVQVVFSQGGVGISYLTTDQMLSLSEDALLRNHGFYDVRISKNTVYEPGDLLVYRGHVTLVERAEGPTGDIIHATGGRDIRLPGQGIQRERFVRFENFRGPLLRILRHKSFSKNGSDSLSASSPKELKATRKLRPVAKRRAANPD